MAYSSVEDRTRLAVRQQKCLRPPGQDIGRRVQKTSCLKPYTIWYWVKHINGLTQYKVISCAPIKAKCIIRSQASFWGDQCKIVIVNCNNPHSCVIPVYHLRETYTVKGKSEPTMGEELYIWCETIGHEFDRITQTNLDVQLKKGYFLFIPSIPSCDYIRGLTQHAGHSKTIRNILWTTYWLCMQWTGELNNW